MPATALKTEERVWIPTLSPAELARRVAQIRPVVRKTSILNFIEPVDPVNQSYLWDPKVTEPAPELVEASVIKTYHEYGAPNMFKPSIAEVLAAIPEDQIAGLVAFEIIGQPQSAEDLNDEREALDAGYHMALTRLYRQA